ncbi:hypothetical protein Tco_0515809, partial [Tanacetum coccineum]
MSNAPATSSDSNSISAIAIAIACINLFEKYVEISHEAFKSDNENVLGIHDNEEEEIAFLDGLLEDENFFKMNDKKDETFERKTKEDFETKVEPEKKKEL